MKKCHECHGGTCGVALKENELADDLTPLPGDSTLTYENTSCSCDSHHSHHNHDHEEDDCGCGHEHGVVSKESVQKGLKAVIIAVGVALLSLLFAQESIMRTILLGTATIVAGLPIFIQGIKNIIKLNLDELALLTIAVIAATLIQELPEALLVTILFRVGEILEDIAIARSRREVEAISQIVPDNANKLAEDGTSQVVPAQTLQIGDRILIKSGERVPVDSIVLSGTSTLDTSSLTGESVVREVQPGDTLLSGAVNTSGVLTCEATSTLKNSTANKIVEMVRDSAAKKGQAEKLISKFARVYTPIVIALSAMVAILPPLFGFGSFSMWLGRSLVFLVASCPCALVIATPLAFFAGIGGASKNGVLIKGSKYIEVLAQTSGVVMDKTGTLTTGKLKVDQVIAAEGIQTQEVLKLAAICESYSNHPIAKAIVAHAGSVDTSLVTESKEITASGMQVQIGSDAILCGSTRLMEAFDVKVSHLPPANVYIAKNGIAIGAIQVFDNPREDAAQTIRDLRALGVEQIAMLTGDSRNAAEKAAQIVGIEQVHAQLLPQDKVSLFEKIKSASKGKTLFVGDGINDSPVLAMADAGVSMGMGSDAAIEAADIVLLSDKLSSLPQAIRIARRTSRLARFNIAFSLLVKLAVFVLAILGWSTMWMAVFADVGVAILTVLNATRALRFR